MKVDFGSASLLLALSGGVIGSKPIVSEDFKRRLGLTVVEGFVRSVPENGEKQERLRDPQYYKERSKSGLCSAI